MGHKDFRSTNSFFSLMEADKSWFFSRKMYLLRQCPEFLTLPFLWRFEIIVEMELITKRYERHYFNFFALVSIETMDEFEWIFQLLWNFSGKYCDKWVSKVCCCNKEWIPEIKPKARYAHGRNKLQSKARKTYLDILLIKLIK